MAWSSVLWLAHRVRRFRGRLMTWSEPALATGASSFGLLTVTVAVVESVSPSESATVSLNQDDTNQDRTLRACELIRPTQIKLVSKEESESYQRV